MVDKDRIKQAVYEIIKGIGEDPDRMGLRETPERVARFWKEFINHNCGNLNTTFEIVTADQMVIVAGIPVWSLCEHHLMPFSCDLNIGYIARDRVLGLSKFARVAQKMAHKLQVQERLVSEIASEIIDLTGSPDVIVLGQGRHLCMIMRGVKSEGSMITMATRGAFRDDIQMRNEFLSLVNSRASGHSLPVPSRPGNRR